ncbi:MAG: hypothetical protein ACJAR1_000188 [Rubritalea sp.]
MSATQATRIKDRGVILADVITDKDSEEWQSIANNKKVHYFPLLDQLVKY